MEHDGFAGTPIVVWGSGCGLLRREAVEEPFLEGSSHRIGQRALKPLAATIQFE
jgi:hypothetical protein